MTTEEIRKEWCKIKGFNYIDFDTLKEAEEYILFLESKIEALNIAGVVKRYTISYTDKKGKTLKAIEIDADSETNALGKFCLKVPLGLWKQIKSEDE